jgi:hypothetical protein
MIGLPEKTRVEFILDQDRPGQFLTSRFLRSSTSSVLHLASLTTAGGDFHGLEMISTLTRQALGHVIHAPRR